MSAIYLEIDPAEQQIIEQFLVYHYRAEFGPFIEFQDEMALLVSQFFAPFAGEEDEEVSQEFVIKDVVGKLNDTEKIALAGLLIMVMDADGKQALEELALLQLFLVEINEDDQNSFAIANIDELFDMDFEELKSAVTEEVNVFFRS